ncbi:MAG: FtsK/SpoIIIE domain-containing protein, partial [Ktedonobacteraceae bacterium]
MGKRKQKYEQEYDYEDYQEYEEDQDEEADPQSFDLPLLSKAGIIAAPGIPLAAIELLAHGGVTSVALTGFGLAFLAMKGSPWLIEKMGENTRLLLALSTRDDLRQRLDAFSNGHFTRQIEKLQAERPDLFDEQYLEEPYWNDQDQAAPLDEEDEIDSLQADLMRSGEQYDDEQEYAEQILERLSIDVICQHIERNSYTIYLGRSMTKGDGPALPVNFYKQHIKIIGTSQRGKSSMAAIIITIITATHDPACVQLALLDQENITARLFAHLPHLASWRGVKLHAQTPEQVTAYLGYLVDMMDYRYTLPTAERKALPLVLMYLEEFLDLKNDLRLQIKLFAGSGMKQEREEATKRYAQFMMAINKLALRGLKARMQFLLCAHTDYADEDFRDALSQFGICLSFCAKPTAAQAAGFTDYGLLSFNAKEDQAGTAVIEAPGVTDLLLAPDYDIDAHLIDLENRQAQLWNVRRPAANQTPETPRYSNREAQYAWRPDIQTPSHR